VRRWSGFCAVAIVLLAARVDAQVVCGAVLGPGGSFVATADVGPCGVGVDPALTIIGPVEVDFAGFRVNCDLDGVDGIAIEGKGAEVSNGSVTRCLTGVRVAGEGKHEITQMEAEENEDDGFVVESDGNKLEHNLARENGRFSAIQGDGFEVTGDKNTLTENWSTRNGKNGFDVDGEGCKLTGNIAAVNEEVGIKSDGAKGKFKENTAGANERSGFAVTSNSTFTKELSSGNDGDTVAHGFFLNGAMGAKLTRGVAVGNQGSGYSLFSTASVARIGKAVALGNEQSGVAITDGSTDNSVKGSTAIGNGNVDLFDGNADCATTTWSKNRFGHADPAACID